jgi:hypothetical protein
MQWCDIEEFLETSRRLGSTTARLLSMRAGAKDFSLLNHCAP